MTVVWHVKRATVRRVKQRRTQAERRAATRSLLLDAALAVLVEEGYTALTTRKVAERAGVSPGAQQHHYATKHEFVVAALRHAVDQLADDVLGRIDLDAMLSPGRMAGLLDEVWAIHRSPTFAAALELWSAARGDDELRRAVRELERDLVRTLGGAVRAPFEDERDAAVAIEVVQLALASARGYAMLAPVVPGAELDRMWAIARGHLVDLLEAHVGSTRR